MNIRVISKLKILIVVLSVFCSERIFSQKIDFSQDWINDFTNDSNLKVDNRFISLFNSLDFSKEFMYMSDIKQIWSDHGIFGINNDRIDIAILSVKKNVNNPLIYEVTGKSRLKKNICEFHGNISIKQIKKYSDEPFVEVWTGEDHFKDTILTGRLIAEYEFKEDSNSVGSGCFKGIFSADIQIYPHNLKYFSFIGEWDKAKYRGSYVGIWQDWKTSKIKKCIWTIGDEDFPFAGDFWIPLTKAEIAEHKKHQGCKYDIPSRNEKINPKYIKNGWVEYWKDYEHWWEKN
jgi:hypothetical protein